MSPGLSPLSTAGDAPHDSRPIGEVVFRTTPRPLLARRPDERMDAAAKLVAGHGDSQKGIIA